MDPSERSTTSECRYSDLSDYDHHGDEDDELRKAARAGILLLEKNQELQSENAALRAQVDVLENERPRLHRELKEREIELETLRDERKRGLLEANTLRGELRAKSSLVTDLLDREQRLKEFVSQAEDAKRVVEFQLSRLQTEFDEYRQSPDTSLVKADYAVANPASTYDSNQASVFTLADYEELVQKCQTTRDENDTLHLELKSARKDLFNLRRTATRVVEAQEYIERLEKKITKLQDTTDALHEERTEERALIESLRSMNSVYKKIAESRPFSTECTCKERAPEEREGNDKARVGVSVQDELLETNKRLEGELRQMRVRLESGQSVDKESLDGSSNHVDGDGSFAAPELFRMRRRSSMTLSLLDDTSTSSIDFGDTDGVNEKLVRKIHELHEKLSVAKDMMRNIKQQWQGAIASQKALEQCNQTAQEEISRLTQLVDYQMSSMAGQRRSSFGERSGSECASRFADDDEEDDKWVEETAPYPAPPGDLNSPLIKCLLDHWTTDKSKIMHLTDWLHHAIRGTGKPMPLRLDDLTSEVAAGFTQLLAPILRERHGVAVTIYRRDSVQVVSDLVLQAHHPTSLQQTGIFSTIAAKLSSLTSPSSAVDSPPTSEHGTNAGRSSQPENPVHMSETDFLYG